MAAKLQRVHSVTQRSIHMREAEVESVLRELEAIVSDESFAACPRLKGCAMRDGWLPIASVLNFSALGRIVWPFGGVGVVSDCLLARSSMVVELSGDSVHVRKKPLRVQLRDQLELIYSELNYPKDVYLQLLENAHGFARLDQVCAPSRRPLRCCKRPRRRRRGSGCSVPRSSPPPSSSSARRPRPRTGAASCVG